MPRRIAARRNRIVAKAQGAAAWWRKRFGWGGSRLAGMMASRFRVPFFLLAVAAQPALFAQRTVPVENELVRVVSVVDRQVAKPGAMHEHVQNRVMIYLDPGEIQIRFAEPTAARKDEDQHWKAGDVAWSPAGGLHTSQHVSADATRIVEIELKKPGGGRALGAGPKEVPIDNGQVRVYRSSVRPGDGANFVAVNVETAEVVWNGMPAGNGPFVITLLK